MGANDLKRAWLGWILPVLALPGTSAAQTGTGKTISTPPPHEERYEDVPPDKTTLVDTSLEATQLLPDDGAGPGALLDLGELSFTVSDLVWPGKGIDLEWTRTYRSRAPEPLVTPMGKDWDHSYNVFVRETHQNLEMHRGNGRVEYFALQADGTYTSPGHFEVFEENPDGSLTLHWSSGTHWEFAPLDGAAAAGYLTRQEDSNGNALVLSYDTAGRLTSIEDTLQRTLSIAYTPPGRIASITDATGRTVSYAYYADGDAGGSKGDLKSATSPAVLGTPTGNDFPSGKTTVYTYSKGTGDRRRDHNLLSITGPDGSTWLQNEFSSQADPDEHDYDRLIRQVVGGSDEWHYSYEDRTRIGGPRRSLAVVNDPRGAVRDLSYDEWNRLRVAKVYTGFANPTTFSTSSVNRPTGKLRPGDPTFFRTSYAYNRDHRLTRVVHPEGNVDSFTYEADLDPAASRLTAGNLREWRRVPGVRGASQTELVESWTYVPGSDRVATYTDAAGKVTSHLYDSAGNRTRTTLPGPGAVHDFEYDACGRLVAHVSPADDGAHRRRDEFTYHTLGPALGYLASITRDAAPGGLALVRTFDWNERGYLVQIVDEESNPRDLVRNELGQLVRLLEPPIAAHGGARTATDFHWDENDRLVGIERENRDETGALEANPLLSTHFDHDAVGRVTRVVREVDAGTDRTTEYDYDPAGNPSEIRFDGAVSGARPGERLTALYDERDLPFRQVRAPGTADQSTTEVDYDRNGSRKTLRAGLEDGARTTSYAYDGYDRLLSESDPMGNVRSSVWGPVARVSEALHGELDDVPGNAGNVLLASRTFQYDMRHRPTQVTLQRFDPSTGMPLGTGSAVWAFTWDALDGLLSVTDPSSSTRTAVYDRLHRPETVTDARGNTWDYAYDDVDRPIGVTETHQSDVGNPPAAYVWGFGYDEAGRLVSRTEPGRPAATFELDSRGNVRRAVDERGEVTRFLYDGLDRITEVVREIAGAKTGPGQTTTYAHDPSLGLTGITDDDGWTTTFAYDLLGRRTSIVYPDLTAHATIWDAHGDPVTVTDPNGTVVTSTFDGLGRPTSRSVVPGPGVSSDTLAATFAHDGRGLLVEAADEDATVARQHDSLGGLLSEALTIQVGMSPVALTTTLEHDAAGNVTRITYPGGRVLDQQWDALGRLASIEEGATTLCTNDYAGPRQRLERMSFANGSATDYTYDARLLPVRAEVAVGMTSLADRLTSWNDTGQVTQRMDALTGKTLSFGVDSLGRTVSSSETPMMGPPTNIAYDLSDAGDRLSVTGGPDAGAYTLDPMAPPADAQVHQYTSTPFDTRTYDDAGNLVGRDPVGPPPADTFEYDAVGRLVTHVDGPSGTVTQYRHDALGRLVLQRDDALGTPTATLFALLEGRVLEELTGGGASAATYVWSSSSAAPDSLVSTPTVAHLSGVHRGSDDYVLHQDAQGSVVAASDAAGLLAESYAYGDFGQPRFFDALGMPLAGSAIDNAYLFRGARWHAESRLYDTAGLLEPPTLQEPRVGRTISRAELGTLGMPGCSLRERGYAKGAGPGSVGVRLVDLGPFPVGPPPEGSLGAGFRPLVPGRQGLGPGSAADPLSTALAGGLATTATDLRSRPGLLEDLAYPRLFGLAVGPESPPVAGVIEITGYLTTPPAGGGPQGIRRVIEITGYLTAPGGLASAPPACAGPLGRRL